MENNSGLEARPLSAYLHKVAPNETYLVWVRAYSGTNSTYTDSDSEKILTFPEPNNITVISYGAYNLKLEWNTSSYIKNFTFQYTLLTSNDWKNVTDIQIVVEGNSVVAGIDGLKPKTQYKFRFLLMYPKYEKLYVWPKDSRFTFETLGNVYEFLNCS